MKERILKNLIILLSAAFATLHLSCSAEPATEASKENNLQKAQLMISLNTENSRSAIPATIARSFSTVYEILLYNSHSSISTCFKQDETMKLSVPEGTWNMLILAGNSGMFFGSGWSDNLLLVKNETTEVSIDLFPLDISLKAPEKVFCNSEYQITFTADTRNPHLALSYIYLITDSSKGKIEFGETSQTVFGTKTLTAPAQTGTLTARFSTSGVWLVCNELEIMEKLECFAELKGIAGSTIWQEDGFTLCSTIVEENSEASGIRAVITWKD